MTDKNIIKTHQSSILKTIPLRRILSLLKNREIFVSNHPKGQVIHFDGERCTKLEIVLTGSTAVERVDESGNTLPVTVFHSNDIIGGNLIFSKKPIFPMTVIAKSDTDVLNIEKDILFALLTENEKFLAAFLEVISDTTIILSNRISQYVNRSVREKIITYLKSEYKTQNSVEIKLHSTKKALAGRMGIRRTSLSRELQKLKKEGLIRFDSSTIEVLDMTMIE